MKQLTIEEILTLDEGQNFDRKSIKIEGKTLAITLCAFANADGGVIAIGVTDGKRQIEGIDNELLKINDLLRVSMDYCRPTIQVRTERLPCKDREGKDNHILLMYVEPSMQVHSNQADEVYMRVGDRSKKLSFEDWTQLIQDKGLRYFEDSPVADASLEDINMDFVDAYIQKIGYPKKALDYLKENKEFVKEKEGKLIISTAGILLFGKCPQKFFPRARVRFIRYEGVEEKFGTHMNVIKDVIFNGTILDMAKESIAFLNTQIKEKTYLGEDGLFVTEEEYPKFVLQEVIINAVTHRDYSIKGTDIQIKMFDDRMIIESPGKLPGLVKPENIRQTHFSRNPKIAEFLKDYKYVKEYGEGVNRMALEMEAIGLPEPSFYKNSFLLQTIIKNKKSCGQINQAFLAKERGIEYGKVAIKKDQIKTEDRDMGVEKIRRKCYYAGISQITMENMVKAYGILSRAKTFEKKDLSIALNCSDLNAGKIIEIMKLTNIIKTVQGKGKDKYRFN